MLFGCVFQTQLKVDVSNLKEDISKLKSQIVESPEELKSQMERMRENVKNIKTSIVSRKAVISQSCCLKTDICNWFFSFSLKLFDGSDFRKIRMSVWWSCRTWCRI